jgi:methanogenic corrinoid protein MtbC1
MMLEGAGFKVHNIGINVPPDKFAHAISEYNPDILCLSSLITSTLPWLRETIKVIREAYPGRPLKIMVGGAPVTHELADEIGADGYGKDAQEAVEKALSLLAEA